MAHSEDQLQPKLDRPGATELIERIERPRPKIASGTSKAMPQHLEGLPEWATETGEVTDWLSEVRMVQNVEHLSAKLQLQRLTNDKLAMDCKIPLSSAKSPQRIPRQVSLPDWKTGVRIDSRS